MFTFIVKVITGYFLEILTVIGVLLTALYTRKTAMFIKAQLTETLPSITFIQPINKKGQFEIKIANKKPHPITVKEVYYQKKYLKFFLSHKKDIKWRYPQAEKFKNHPTQNIFSAKTTIVQEEIYPFEIPNFDKTAIYKISVETSVGYCHIYLYPS